MDLQSDLIQKDVAIIGAGPAGLSALLWCADLGLDAAIVEQRPEPGGQLLAIHSPITNCLGLETQNGREMRDLFVKHAGSLLTPQFIGTAADSIDVHSKEIQLSDGRTIRSAAIILAAGVRRRRLGTEGETEFQGKGILESGAKEKELVKGKRVVIVGGGDAALENAVILGDVADQVTVIHRRGSFRARQEFIDAAESRPNISFLMNAKVSKISGSNAVEYVEVIAADGRTISIHTDAVLIRIGVEPNSDLVRSSLRVDAGGYVMVDSQCRTSVPGIFAIGDVAEPDSPTISTAVGMGATAAKSIFSLLNAGM